MSENETASIAQGFAKCEKPERYIQQLVSHWGHKYATSYDEGDGMGTFPFSDTDPLVKKLLTIKGIGLITAVTLRAEIGRFDRFRTGKQLARFCGLSPRNASSGQKQADAGLIQAGNKELKSLLIEAAHRLIRCEERWTALAARLSSRGKKGCVVVAAVANRWLRWLFHQVQPSCLAV